MMSSSAFIRGEGTPADVRRSTAAFRACLNCTYLFHHGEAETRRKTNEGRIERSTRVFMVSTELFERRHLPSFARLGRARAPVPTRARTTALHHARRLLLHLLRLIVRGQCIDNRLQLSVHHLLELMNGEADAMIREAVLREIVSPYLLRAVAGPYHLLAFFRQRVLLLLHLDFVQP